jgi:hypothetical protein
MNRQTEKPTNLFKYNQNDTLSICALCGNERGVVYFRRQLICEECRDIIKEIY